MRLAAEFGGGVYSELVKTWCDCSAHLVKNAPENARSSLHFQALVMKPVEAHCITKQAAKDSECKYKCGLCLQLILNSIS